MAKLRLAESTVEQKRKEEVWFQGVNTQALRPGIVLVREGLQTSARRSGKDFERNPPNRLGA